MSIGVHLGHFVEEVKKSMKKVAKQKRQESCPEKKTKVSKEEGAGKGIYTRQKNVRQWRSKEKEKQANQKRIHRENDKQSK